MKPLSLFKLGLSLLIIYVVYVAVMGIFNELMTGLDGLMTGF